jgi:hypothetical protein
MTDKKDDTFNFGSMDQTFSFDSNFKSDFSFDSNLTSQFTFGESKTTENKEDEEEEDDKNDKPEEECNATFKPLIDLKDMPEVNVKSEEETFTELYAQY